MKKESYNTADLPTPEEEEEYLICIIAAVTVWTCLSAGEQTINSIFTHGPIIIHHYSKGIRLNTSL